MGSASIKIYDKFGRVLRIEATSNDVSFFKHHRKVEHRDGTQSREPAPLKKSIYSLIDLREILFGCNRRHLEFISSLDDHSDGQILLNKLKFHGFRSPWRIRESSFDGVCCINGKPHRISYSLGNTATKGF